jgi:hypothetical protein
VAALRTTIRYSYFQHGAITGVTCGPGADYLDVATTTFYQIGTGAVNVGCSNALVRWGYYFGNHNEYPFNAPGGQIVLERGANAATVAWNLIDGMFVQGSNGLATTGIEGYGSNHQISANTIRNNSGHGISMSGVSNVLISGLGDGMTNDIENNGTYSGAGALPSYGVAISAWDNLDPYSSGVYIANLRIVGPHKYSIAILNHGSQIAQIGNVSIWQNTMWGYSHGGICTLGYVPNFNQWNNSPSYSTTCQPPF